MKKKLFTILSFLAAAALFSAGCSSPASTGGEIKKASDELRILTIGTADSGGTMYPAGRAIAQVIGDSDEQIKVNISASNGSQTNVLALESGDIDLGLVSGDVAFSAVNGFDEFEGNPVSDLRIISAVYPSLSNWLAPSSLGIEYVHDLKGKRIGIGPQASTTEISARIVLEATGIDQNNTTLENCGLGSGSESVKNGTLDAVHGFAGIPISGLSELAEEIPCTVLKYTSDELYSILRENTFYYPDVIPAGTYKGQEEDVDTFGIKCLLCVRADMDDELVYELTSILYENTDVLAKEHPSLASMSKNSFMCDNLPIELHPGAERFYKEKGVLPEQN